MSFHGKLGKRVGSTVRRVQRSAVGQAVRNPVRAAKNIKKRAGGVKRQVSPGFNYLFRGGGIKDTARAFKNIGRRR